MDLGEALYRAITHNRSPHTEPDTFAKALPYVVKQAGSVAGAARLLDIPRRTLRDWIAGKHSPSEERRNAVVSAAVKAERRKRLPKGREKRMRQQDPQPAGLTATYRYTDERERDDFLGPYIDPFIDELLDAYLDGASLDELHDIFAGAINDGGFYAASFQREPGPGWEIGEVDLG